MNFDNAARFVLSKEGGYSNDKVDRGGATNFGISSRGNPGVDVKNLTEDGAKAIYKAKYWDSIGADSLPEGMRLAAFDAAVQHGPDTAIKMIEASDGTADSIINQRRELYGRIVAKDPSQKKFEKGWNNRLVSVQAATSQKVARQALEGASIDRQIASLRAAGHGPEIEYAQSLGWGDEDIVKNMVPEFEAAQRIGADRKGKSLLQNVSDGVVDTGQRLLRGGQQILATGDDEARLKAEEAADRNDPNKIALRGTVGAKIGAAAPIVAAAAIPGVNTVLGAAALGGGLGALQPTVEGESRLQNTGLGAVTGGGAAGVGKLVGGALNRSVQAAQKGLRGGQTVDEITAQVKALEDQGISVAARDLSPVLSRAANDAERVVGSRIGQVDRAVTRDQELSRAVTRKLGQEADVLDSGYISTAQKRIGSQFDEALDGVSVDGSRFASQLDDVVAAQQKGLSSLQSGLPSKVAAELKAKFDAGPVSATELQGIRTMVSRELSNPSIDASTREGLSQISKVLNNGLESALPSARLAKWKTANDQWRHLQSAENMVRMSNDTGDISTRQLASSIKSGKFKGAYERGDAPYQALQKSLSAVQTGKQGLINSGFDAGAMQALGAYATGGISLPAAGITANIALRLLNSTNPKIRSALLGLTPVKQAELRRLAVTGALVSYPGT